MNETGEPVDDTVRYCDVSDVKRFTRGELTQLDDTDVQKWIDEKTRYFERESVTAFRKLEVNDFVRPVNFSNIQKRDTPNSTRSSVTGSRFPVGTGSSERWIDIELPNDRIDSIDKIELITNETRDITNETDEWELLNPREGMIRVKHLSFYQTLGGKTNEDKFKDAKIKVSYTYGRDSVKPDVRDAVAKLSAYDIINSDAFGDVRSDDSSGFVGVDEMTERWRQEALDVIDAYK